MNKEIAQLWVDALRSGKYQQTKGRLHRTVGVDYGPNDSDNVPAGYCCLGVLCEIAVEKQIIKVIDTNETGSVSYGLGTDRSMTWLPGAVVDWSGLRDTTVWVVINGYRNRYGVAELNDSLGFSFSQIADAIEDNFIKDAA